MASIQDVKLQIENANALGRANLSEKGVSVNEDATTYEIMQSIAEVQSGEEIFDFSPYIKSANQLFQRVGSFPTKAVVNLPVATTLTRAFSYWELNTIPMVEEITVNAPNLNINSDQSLYQVFLYNHCVERIILNLSNENLYMNSTFYGSSKLLEVVLGFSTKNITSSKETFSGSTKLIKIDGVLDFSSNENVTNMFYGCSNLEYVRFEPNTLSVSISLGATSKLSAESVQSIIDGLATVETAQTLTLNKAISLTDEQKATINAKGWTLTQ